MKRRTIIVDGKTFTATGSTGKRKIITDLKSVYPRLQQIRMGAATCYGNRIITFNGTKIFWSKPIQK